jgi:pyridoxal phosphate enzyme (YggS family)
MSTITKNIQALRQELPAWVTLVAAAKQRSTQEVQEALDAGICVLGENYVQEALQIADVARGRAQMHFIGHLQKNKVASAVKIFDMIETVDSLLMAEEINRRCVQIEKVMPVLIEINSAREPQKSGVLPEQAENLVKSIACLSNIKITGLMTMGPYSQDAEELRPSFFTTRRVYHQLADLDIPGVEMKYLSMGMSNSYRVAIEEGANIVRIGTKIFGERGKD